MAKKPPVPCSTSIGDTAGVIWHLLDQSGPMTMAKLVKGVDEPRDMVMLGLGWLAKEEKIDIKDDGRNRVVSLR